MENKNVFTGLAMLLAPLIIYLVYLLVISQIDWGSVMEKTIIFLGIIIGIMYVVFAFALIIKGAFSDK